ncbi:selenocysteine-specific translation elongation factor [Gordonia alkaliphila]|uniref:selenocysteine-specific translation elongation factor n=1 Tax=Gordonia alkaliphila TaxID=1053547 RepID=UPI001FF5935E|nr:selenocysteine-specific translation elongation factor [Gordonia alkaliphila]MCK0439886.1 selenocysteine-specific translation elongation factor [Gordonia alkaliphila]
MFVVATAGHVDHGKSTLAKALTGMEPDRWAAERERGLTIDLGFVWTELSSGRQVGFVDVPGHQRFLGNMLAGLGPAPVVLFIVAADEGWMAQSSDHRDALAALGISAGLIVVTRTDRATPERVAEVIGQARDELSGTGLAEAPAVAVSAITGDGLDALRAELDALLGGLPAPSTDERVRLWVDRSFTIAGAGTVVTGTLAAGTLALDQPLEVVGRHGSQSAVVRGLQSYGREVDRALPVSRVAVNLRGIAADEVHRGDALLTPGAWPQTAVVDVRSAAGEVPEWLTVHLGTAAVPARSRALDDEHLRLTLAWPVPLQHEDTLLLRDPSAGRIVGGATVLDVDPPVLRRRGDGARRGSALSQRDVEGRVLEEVARRGAVLVEQLAAAGLPVDAAPEGVLELGRWWVAEQTLHHWQVQLREAVVQAHRTDPLAAGLSFGAARDQIALPDAQLLPDVIAGAGVQSAAGLLFLPELRADLGPAEAGIVELEKRLAAAPFAAPEADDLAHLRLGTKELAAAERAGRLVRLADGVVLAPKSPALAMRELAALPQPFTTSQARQALGTSRRVAIPLLEFLDARGWTRRVDGSHREVVR